MIKFILAVGVDNVIGNSQSSNGLPWHYPEDLKYFKEQTEEQVIVMGHNTFKQIGKPLPNRINIILTRDQTIKYDEVLVMNNKEEVLQFYSDLLDNNIKLKKELYSSLTETHDLYICGGLEIYKLFEDCVEEILITRILDKYKGDKYYEDLDYLLLNFEKSSSISLNKKGLIFEIYSQKSK